MQNFKGPFSYHQNYEIKMQSDEEICCLLNVDGKFPPFDGHFDVFQLLPGAVQLGVIEDVLQFFVQSPMIIQRVYRTKFLAPILPDLQIEIQLRITKKNERVDWVISQSGQMMSKGMFDFKLCN